MKKSFWIAEILCLLFGCLGFHRYYTGYIKIGIIQTLTFGGCGVWSLIDFISINIGRFKDANGEDLEGFDKNIGIAVLCAIVFLTLLKLFGIF